MVSWFNEFQGASDVNTYKTRNLITAKADISLRMIYQPWFGEHINRPFSPLPTYSQTTPTN